MRSVLQFAERHVDGPLVRAYRVQAIIRKVDTLADAHAGVAQQQEDIAGEIVAAEQFLLQERSCSAVSGRGSLLRRRGISSRRIR